MLEQGDITNYHETQVMLLRNLFSLRAGNIIAKITISKPRLKDNDWSSVTADVSKATLTLTTFNTTGLSLLTELQT